MKILPGILLFVYCSLSFACGGAYLNGFDAESWKQDSLGCRGSRKILAAEIVKQKKTLMGRNREDVLNLFGKPNNIGSDNAKIVRQRGISRTLEALPPSFCMKVRKKIGDDFLILHK